MLPLCTVFLCYVTICLHGSMDEDFNWFAVHVFDDTVGHSWQTCVIVVGVCPFFVLLRCFLSIAKRKSGREICVLVDLYR